MSQKISTRQLRQHTVLPMIGNSADEAGDSLLSKIDAQHSKLFEDRNVLLVGGGITAVNSTATSVSFTATLSLFLNSKVAGGAPVSISLGSATRAFTADGNMLYAVVDRLAGTATVTADSTTLPAVTSANQEVFLIAKRVGTNIYFRNGQSLAAGTNAPIGRIGATLDTEFIINDATDPTKQIAFDAGGTTGTKTTLTAAQTANRVLTLPDVTDTLVSRTNTETLSNKQIQYSSANDAATTGGNATLAAFTTGIVRLTNASLISLSGIPAGASGQFLILENKTGNQIAINNEETTATAANRIQTGNGGNTSMPNNAVFMFTYDSTSARWQLSGGSGSGSGGSGSKNYLSAVTTSQSSTPNTGNGNFESGSTTGWSLGNIGGLSNNIPTGVPTFGSGASGNLSISTVNTNRLAGAYSLSYASSAATTQGNMLASDAMNIDSESQGKVLSWSFLYKAQVNPTNGNFSGTSSNTFGVAVYDVTNSVWLGLAGYFNLTQNTGVGKATGTFQTGITTTQLRFVVYNANASAGAITMYFDDFFVGPQPVDSQAPAMSDWTSYTPTGNWTTNTTYAGKWRRVGSNMEVQATVSLAGAPGGTSQFTVNLPFGSIDTNSFLLNASGENRSMGIANILNSGNQNDLATVEYSSNTAVQLGAILANGTYATTDSVVNATVPHTFKSGDRINLAFSVPIVGWSSNSVMSSDTDTRVCALRVSGAPAGVGNGVVATFNQTIYDTHGALVSSRFVAPITGYYRSSGTARLNAAVTSTLYNYIDGVIDTELTGLNDTAGHGFSVTVFLRAGQILDVRPNNTVTFSALLWMVERVTGPSVIAASEKIMARYQVAGSVSYGTAQPINYATKTYDTHNAVTTGSGWRFTAPAYGIYKVNVTGAPSSTLQAYQLFKNGSLYSYLVTQPNGGNLTINGFDSIVLLPGEYIDVRGDSPGTTNANGTIEHITIERTS